MTRIQGLIFDLDDTLYPEIQYVLSGFRAVAEWCFERFGFPPDQTYEQIVCSFRSGNRTNTIDGWFVDRGLEPSFASQAVEVYRAHLPAISCFPGLVDMLGRLKPALRLGIVSDGLIEVQKRKLAALGIAGYFDAVVFSDQWGREYWKPHPRPYLFALEQMSVNAHDAVYVGDNPLKDFIGARSLGIRTVLLSGPDSIYAMLLPPTPRHGPDALIHNILELEPLLERFGESTKEQM